MKWVLFRRCLIAFLSLLPLVLIIVQAITNRLGADPQKAIVVFTGTWTFYFLLATLSITPIKKYARQSWVMLHRRMLGLFTLFYAILHVLSYFAFILAFNLAKFGEELVKRPYILVTIPAIFLLIALGVTSTKYMMRKLGKRWIVLHRSIYLIALLAWLHVFMQVRSSYYEAVLFGVLTGLLLGIRLYWALKKNVKT